MKINNIVSFLLVTLVVTVTSCEEVIQLDLKNTAPRVVISASLNASNGECLVEASKTAGFYDSSNFVKITGARAELVKGNGDVLVFDEVSPGIYSLKQVTVSAGENLQLNFIVSPDERYLAATQAPQEVFLDSLKIVRGFGDPRPTSPPIYLLNLKWKDPAGISNFYRFKLTKNGKSRQGSFNITNDQPFDGTEVDMPLYRYSLEIGDTVRLEFQSIDSLSYAYFNQINDMARPSFVSATPYNPIGNFDKGALGYFGVFWTQVKDTIISLRK